MSALSELLAARTTLSDEQVRHVQRLVGEWQLLSDLSFADLVLWLPEADQVTAAFLGGAGWAPDGWARTLDTGSSTLREVRWQTVLGDLAPDDIDERGAQ